MDATSHEFLSEISTWGWVSGFFALVLLAVLLVIAVFVAVDNWIHNRRLRRMYRETMEARQRRGDFFVLSDREPMELPGENGKPVRPRFLS